MSVSGRIPRSRSCAVVIRGSSDGRYLRNLGLEQRSYLGARSQREAHLYHSDRTNGSSCGKPYKRTAQIPDPAQKRLWGESQRQPKVPKGEGYTKVRITKLPAKQNDRGKDWFEKTTAYPNFRTLPIDPQLIGTELMLILVLSHYK